MHHQGRTQNIMNINFSQNDFCPAGLAVRLRSVPIVVVASGPQPAADHPISTGLDI
jgi:hypothetical protein